MHAKSHLQTLAIPIMVTKLPRNRELRYSQEQSGTDVANQDYHYHLSHEYSVVIDSSYYLKLLPHFSHTPVTHCLAFIVSLDTHPFLLLPTGLPYIIFLAMHFAVIPWYCLCSSIS